MVRSALGLPEAAALHPGSAGGIWRVLLSHEGTIVPGTSLAGRVDFQPENGPMEADALAVRLTATERYWVMVHDMAGPGRGGGSSTPVQQNFDLTGPAVVLPLLRGAAGLAAFAFELPIDPAILPSVALPEYQVIWALELRLMVADRELAAYWRHDVPVLETAARIGQGLINYGPGALEADTPATEGGFPVAASHFAVSPLPLRSGASFAGQVTLPGIDGSRLRIALRSVVSSSSVAFRQHGMGPRATDLLTGSLQQVSPGVFAFNAAAAPPVPSIDGPHGQLRTTLVVTLDRLLQPDRNWQRAIAIATDPQL